MTHFTTAMTTLLALASGPCNPVGDLGHKDDTGDTSDTTDTQGMGPCESGLCSLTVTEATVECASDTTSAPVPIEVNATGAGTLEIWHHRVQQGCCPELAVTAEQDLQRDSIHVEYDLYDDMCDCICDLDVTYTLSDVYSGTFTLYAADDSVEVTVE